MAETVRSTTETRLERNRPTNKPDRALVVCPAECGGSRWTGVLEWGLYGVNKGALPLRASGMFSLR